MRKPKIVLQFYIELGPSAKSKAKKKKAQNFLLGASCWVEEVPDVAWGEVPDAGSKRVRLYRLG